MLLSTRNSALKSCYRAPIDYLEEKTTKAADLLVCNSRFTSGMVKKHFPSITEAPVILHPTTFMTGSAVPSERSSLNHIVEEKNRFFLSINRYEKKKNLKLAIEAFALLEESRRANISLVLAGGFDLRVEENISCFRELEELIEKLKLSKSVKLVKNVSKEDKTHLIEHCIALIYTPANEHFGIVPVEAMALVKNKKLDSSSLLLSFFLGKSCGRVQHWWSCRNYYQWRNGFFV
jgi:alpha-1,3/alpha-1,6-mannosyltransferase